VTSEEQRDQWKEIAAHGVVLARMEQKLDDHITSHKSLDEKYNSLVGRLWAIGFVTVSALVAQLWPK